MKIIIEGTRYDGSIEVACNIVRWLNKNKIKAELEDTKKQFDNVEAGLRDLGSKEALEVIVDQACEDGAVSVQYKLIDD